MRVQVSAIYEYLSVRLGTSIEKTDNRRDKLKTLATWRTQFCLATIYITHHIVYYIVYIDI